MSSFNVITRLSLKEAFEGDPVFSVVIKDEDYLNTLFEHTTRAHIFVIDSADKGVSSFVLDTKGLGRNKLFIAENPLRQDTFLLHIDGVLYEGHRKCDCALLTEREMCFIEFKSNATNGTEKSIESNYEKAYSQLLITITDFAKRFNRMGVCFYSLIKVKAFAVFDRTVPRNNAYQKRLSVSFLKSTGGVKLAFENSTILA